MQRIVIIGTSGSGKTTLALALAAQLDLPVVQLDAVHHQPGWVPLEPDEFRRRAAVLTQGARWVVDGNYSVVRDVVWPAVDTIIWLDLPKRVVMRRVLLRTIPRALAGRELWNGNSEDWRNLVRRDPMKNIILWAWTTYGSRRRRYAQYEAGGQWRHLRFVRIRSSREIAAFLSEIRRSSSAPSATEEPAGPCRPVTEEEH